MKPVQQQKLKHWSRMTADEIAFYYSKGCKVFPTLYSHYFDLLTHMERHGKVCLTPNAVLERYHMQLQYRIEQRIRRIAKMVNR